MDNKKRNAITKFVGLHVTEEVEDNILKWLDLDIEEIEDSYLGKVVMSEKVDIDVSHEGRDNYEDFVEDMELYEATRSQIDNSLGNIYNILDRRGLELDPKQKIELESHIDQALKDCEMEIQGDNLKTIQDSSNIITALYLSELEVEYLDTNGDTFIAPIQAKLNCAVKTVGKKMEMESIEIISMTLMDY